MIPKLLQGQGKTEAEIKVVLADVSSERRAIDYNMGRRAAFDKMFHDWLKDMVEYYSLYCALGFNVSASKLPTPPPPVELPLELFPKM